MWHFGHLLSPSSFRAVLARTVCENQKHLPGLWLTRSTAVWKIWVPRSFVQTNGKDRRHNWPEVATLLVQPRDQPDWLEISQEDLGTKTTMGLDKLTFWKPVGIRVCVCTCSWETREGSSYFYISEALQVSCTHVNTDTCTAETQECLNEVNIKTGEDL